LFSADAGALDCAGRSAELQKLVRADQEDYRKDMTLHPERPLDLKKMMAMMKNDLRRRKRVGEIFGEGCLRSAADYSAAALIYQHGEVPDHFFQAFLWFREAVRWGDETKKGEMALAVDRYLTKSGKKQLFGSQLSSIDTIAPGKPACYCLEPIEDSFPDEMRDKYLDRRARGFEVLAKFNAGKDCAPKLCAHELAPTPAGSVPGFW
jgi:hypothetical protein